MVVVAQLIEDVGSMRKQQRISIGSRRRNAAEIGPVQRRIIGPHESQLSGRQRDKSHLIDEQHDFVPIEEFSEFIDADAAVVIVIAENDKHRSYSSQLGQEMDEMGKPVPDIQQVSRDEDPVRARRFYGPHDLVMAREIAIQMEIAQLHAPSPGHGRMGAG